MKSTQEKERFVKNFRRKFKKRFMVDINAALIVFGLMCSVMFSLPFLIKLFDFDLFYVLIILQMINTFILVLLLHRSRNE
jgi:hypothetical protein